MLCPWVNLTTIFFCPHWTPYRHLLHSSKMISFHIVFCLLLLASGCEHLERTVPYSSHVHNKLNICLKKVVSRKYLGKDLGWGNWKEGCLSFLSLRPWFSNCGLWTSSIYIAWELFREAHSQAWPQTYWIRTSVFFQGSPEKQNQ